VPVDWLDVVNSIAAAAILGVIMAVLRLFRRQDKAEMEIDKLKEGCADLRKSAEANAQAAASLLSIAAEHTGQLKALTEESKRSYGNHVKHYSERKNLEVKLAAIEARVKP